MDGRTSFKLQGTLPHTDLDPTPMHTKSLINYITTLPPPHHPIPSTGSFWGWTSHYFGRTWVYLSLPEFTEIDFIDLESGSNLENRSRWSLLHERGFYLGSEDHRFQLQCRHGSQRRHDHRPGQISIPSFILMLHTHSQPRSSAMFGGENHDFSSKICWASGLVRTRPVLCDFACMLAKSSGMIASAGWHSDEYQSSPYKRVQAN